MEPRGDTTEGCSVRSPSEKAPGAAPAPPVAEADLTGSSRLTRNVLSSWSGHLVFLAAGFVLPRMIDRHVGQEALGVWDFGWSVVAYFMLALGGIISSVNRYVAKHRAAGDMEALRQFVSSVTLVLVIVSLLLTAVTATLVLVLPSLMGGTLAGHVTEARWVVAFLGLSVAVQVAASGYSGVLTGCHRWDLHNGVNAGAYALAVVGMIIALTCGGGLRELAFLNLCGELVGRVARGVLATRVCPGLQVRLRYVRWACVREALTFGSKSFLPQLGEVLLRQTVAILVLTHLGPASLAAYSRPTSLVRHVRTLVQKLAMVLTPTAGSLKAASGQEKLRDLLIKSTRYAVYLALPATLTLMIFGGPILRLWMGPRYEHGLLLALLAGGYLATILLRPAQNILIGMNAHGRPGAASLLAAGVAVGLAYVALGPLDMGLVGAALAVGIPLTLVDGVYVPLLACRRLGLGVGSFVVQVLREPLVCIVPYTACLLAARLALWQRPLLGLGCGLAVGSAVLAPLYWRYALPPSLKKSISSRLGRGRKDAALESAS